MVEFAMIFGLGFFTAALLGLLAAPILVRRAERRARVALERRLPISLHEVAAARDQLAASHAMALRAAEQRAEATGDRLASAMADAGRQLARAVAADGRYAEASAKADTLAAALTSAEQATETVRQNLSARTAELEKSTTESDQRAAALASANERVASIETMIAGQRRLLEEFGQRLAGDAAPDAAAGIAEALAAVDGGSPAGALAGGDEERSLVESRLRLEAAALRRADAMGSAERDRLKLRVDELLLRVSELEEEAGEAVERAEADRREVARQAKLVASLTKRVASRDETIKGLKRQASAVAEGRPAAPTTNAGFREAIAVLAAELVGFAEKEAGQPNKGAPPR